MIQLHAGVDDRDQHSRTPRPRPGLRDMERSKRDLLRVERVVGRIRCAGRGAGGLDRDQVVGAGVLHRDIFKESRCDSRRSLVSRVAQNPRPSGEALPRAAGRAARAQRRQRSQLPHPHARTPGTLDDLARVSRLSRRPEHAGHIARGAHQHQDFGGGYAGIRRNRGVAAAKQGRGEKDYGGEPAHGERAPSPTRRSRVRCGGYCRDRCRAG